MSIVGTKCGTECENKMECVCTEMNEGFERGCAESNLGAHPPR